jgi:hypothetical protein
MSWFMKILGSISGNVAEVDANNNLKVNSPTTASQAGFVAQTGVTGAGTTSGGKRYNVAYVTEGSSVKATLPQLLWDDTFNATAQNTSKYNFAATTQTGAMAAGYLVLNNSAITTANTNSGIQTWKSFPLFGKAELRANFSLMTTTAPQANNLIEFGLFNAVLSTRVAPLDGVFFRYNPSAELRGVINYNGTETLTATITPPSANVNHDYVIVIQTNTVIFMIDDAVVGTISLLTDAPAQGQPQMSATVPLTIRTYIGASTPASATQVKVSDVFVTGLGLDTGRPWSEVKASFGHVAYQGQNGGTMGSTSNWGNGAIPAAAALTNTAVSTGGPVGLGGWNHNSATLAAGTDGIINSFQNPAGGVNQTPRNLVIKGVWVHTIVDATLTGGPLVFLYSLAYGHTAVSMATAEAASFTAGGTTKAPRRIPIGVEGCAATAAAGVLLSPGGVYRQFATPIVIAPGEFVAVVGRNAGTVASVGSVIHTVGYDAYFE